MIENFKFAYFDGRTTEPKESPDWTYWKEKLRCGEKIPVFFQKNGSEIKHFGLSYLYKLPYTLSVKDGIPASHFESNDLDLAQTIFGYIGEKEKRSSIIEKAKIVILPSQFEAFLYTAVETIIQGVPTIVTRNCGVSQYLKTFLDYDNIVVDQNNVDEFRDKISSIMQNYETAKLKTADQREYLKKCVNPKIVAQQYLKLIEKKYDAKRSV